MGIYLKFCVIEKLAYSPLADRLTTLYVLYGLHYLCALALTVRGHTNNILDTCVYKVYNMHHRVQGGEKMRVNINIDDELLSKIDDYAKDKYINRTSAICVLLSNALQGNDINKGLASLKDYRDMLVQLDQSADK